MKQNILLENYEDEVTLTDVKTTLIVTVLKQSHNIVNVTYYVIPELQSSLRVTKGGFCKLHISFTKYSCQWRIHNKSLAFEKAQVSIFKLS